jgi:hypothetical protein
MILRKVLFLRKSIIIDRLNMYEIARDKDLSHPDVIGVPPAKRIFTTLRILQY